MHAGILVLGWALCAAPVNPHLEQATKLMDIDLDFPGAERELELAAGVSGNDRETVLAILGKQALLGVYSQDSERAERYYRRLLVIFPDYLIPASYGPKAAAPFGAAKRWIAKHGALRFVEQPARMGPGSVEEVAVKVLADPLSMASRVRFHLKAGGRPWRVVEATLTAGRAAATTQAERIEWWARLLDSQGGTVALVGSEDKPLLAAIPEAVAVADKPALAEVEWVAPPAGDAPSSGSALRTAGLVSLGASAAALAAGAFFMASGSGARARLDGAERDGSGVVIGLTQREGFELDARSRSQAAMGVGLLGAAAALAVTGGVLVWQSGSVQVAPTPGGVALAGVFP
ncbi:MAG: hypothetical protein ACYC8T_15990 [Myxococcaceae bacterium]